MAQPGRTCDRLEIEITEGVLLQCSTQVQQALSTLRDARVRIAIDDFAAGYASISYLRNYKIDKIKIDRTFIKSLNEDASLMHIVSAMIDMGKAMGLSVTAEGVEDEAQRRALTAMGCIHLQASCCRAHYRPIIFFSDWLNLDTCSLFRQ